MASQKKLPVLVYSISTCPDCRTLKAWLTGHNIAFEERDLSDPAVMKEAKSRTGVRVAPITLVGTDIFYGTFADQKQHLIKALGVSQGS